MREYLNVIKKGLDSNYNAIKEPWDDNKIIKACEKSAHHIGKELTQADKENILRLLEVYINDMYKDMVIEDKKDNKLYGISDIKVSDLHELVQSVLRDIDVDIYESYKQYRDYKKMQSQHYRSLYADLESLNSGVYNENANKDSAIISTKRSLLAEMTQKQLMKDFILRSPWKKAHDEGWIYIHDLGDLYWRTFNCDNVDLGNIIKTKKHDDGYYSFNLNGVKYPEPKSVESAFNLIADLILQMSSQQFGGFSVQNFDSILAPYAELTYDKAFKRYMKKGIAYDTAREMAEEDTLYAIKQGVQGFELEISTISNALGQIPFTSIGFGLDTSKWGREITRAFLLERSEPDCVLVFPKLIFASAKEVNLNPDSPNYDLFQLAIKCSSTKLYPDYVSMDEGILAPAYNRHKDDLSQILSVPMGCRSYNNFMFRNPLSETADYGKEIYKGRGNVGVVTLNFPKMAIESKGNWDEFHKLVVKYTEMICDILDWRYNYVGEARAESNPLMWMEGGAWRQLKHDERIAKTIFNFSASIGIIGYNEALNYMYLNNGYTIDNLPDYKNGGIRQRHQERLTEWVDDVKSYRNFIDSVRIDSDGNQTKVFDRNVNMIAPDPDKEYIQIFTGLNGDEKSDIIHRMYSIYGTPAEGLVYKMMTQLQEQYGKIAGVTAHLDGSGRNYVTNSFHQPVFIESNVYDKIDFEAPFHQDGMASGGHISQNEFAYGTPLPVLEQAVRYAMDKGMYYGINIASSHCFDCGWNGETADICPECSSENVVTIQRVCGYLSITSRNGHSVVNAGKTQEFLERVNHQGNVKKEYTKNFEKHHDIQKDIVDKKFSMFE